MEELTHEERRKFRAAAGMGVLPIFLGVFLSEFAGMALAWGLASAAVVTMLFVDILLRINGHRSAEA